MGFLYFLFTKNYKNRVLVYDAKQSQDLRRMGIAWVNEGCD